MPGQVYIDLAIRPAVSPTKTTTTNKAGSNAATATATTRGPVSLNSLPTPKSAAVAINGRNGGGHVVTPICAVNDTAAAVEPQRRHKHKLSSYSEESPLSIQVSGAGGPVGGGLLSSRSRNNSLTLRPAKRQMATPDRSIAVINASGRQAASLIRYATAVGFRVRAQLRNTHGVIAQEVCTNPSVTVLTGDLYTREEGSGSPSSLLSPTSPTSPAPAAGREGAAAAAAIVDVSREGPISGIGINHGLIAELFRGCQLAFINTTFYGDEEAIGKALADEAKRAGIAHYVYSSMPDHAAYNPAWPSLPLYRSKHRVEEYIRSIGLESTFVYAGIYNNNFTSLPYPLFCMELQPDGSFVWQAPFHPDAALPWLDCEHDFGTAILSIFKEGPKRWGGGLRVPIAFEMLSPREACRAFSRGVGRPVRYVRGPIEVKVKIPEGYRVQLDMVQKLYSAVGRDDPAAQPPYFGDPALEASCPDVALELWGGHRTLEQYAREEFLIEEQANGLRWMLDDGPAKGDGDDAEGREVTQPADDGDDDQDDNDGDEDDDDGLVMSGPKRLEEKWLA